MKHVYIFHSELFIKATIHFDPESSWPCVFNLNLLLQRSLAMLVWTYSRFVKLGWAGNSSSRLWITQYSYCMYVLKGIDTKIGRVTYFECKQNNIGIAL